MVKVLPKANCNAIIGWKGAELCIRVTAVPEKGQANKELINLLANALRISRSQVIIVQGETSRHKRILLSGIGEEALKKLPTLCKGNNEKESPKPT